MKNIMKYIPDSECFVSEIKNNEEVTYIITSLLRTTSNLHMEMVFKLYKITDETVGYTGIIAYSIEEVEQKLKQRKETIIPSIARTEMREMAVHAS